MGTSTKPATGGIRIRCPEADVHEHIALAQRMLYGLRQALATFARKGV